MENAQTGGNACLNLRIKPQGAGTKRNQSGLRSRPEAAPARAEPSFAGANVAFQSTAVGEGLNYGELPDRTLKGLCVIPIAYLELSLAPQINNT